MVNPSTSTVLYMYSVDTSSGFVPLKSFGNDLSMRQVAQNDQSGTLPFARTRVDSREHALSNPICNRSLSGTGAVWPDKRGCQVKVAMQNALSDSMTFPMNRTAFNGSCIPRLSISNANIAPCGAHATRDGEVIFSIQNEFEWVQFCKVVMAQPELAFHEDYRTNSLRTANAAKLTKLIDDKFADESSQEVVQLLDLSQTLPDERLYGNVFGAFIPETHTAYRIETEAVLEHPYRMRLEVHPP